MIQDCEHVPLCMNPNLLQAQHLLVMLDLQQKGLHGQQARGRSVGNMRMPALLWHGHLPVHARTSRSCSLIFSFSARSVKSISFSCHEYGFQGAGPAR